MSLVLFAAKITVHRFILFGDVYAAIAALELSASQRRTETPICSLRYATKISSSGP